MAAQKKKGGGSKRRSSAKKNQYAKQPIRREVGSVICLLLSLFTVLCCFNQEGKVLSALTVLFKGLVGQAFVLLPVLFFLAFLILLLHDGRPVALRVFCTFLMAATMGALLHLIRGQVNAEWGWGMFRELWTTGNEDLSGGVISGILAQALEAVISKPGAMIVLGAAFILELVTSLNMTVRGIVLAFRNRPRLEYDEPEYDHPDLAEVLVNRMAQTRINSIERRRSRQAADLPVDEARIAPAEQPEQPEPEQSALPEAEPAAEQPTAEIVSEEQPQPLPEPAPETKRKSPERPDAYILRRIRAAEAEAQGQPEEEKKTDYHEELELLVNETAEQQTAPAEPEEAVQEPDAEAFDAPTEPEAEPEELPPQEEEVPETESDRLLHQLADLVAQAPAAPERTPEYVFPTMDCLHIPDGRSADGTDEMRQNAERLADTLQSFNIDAQIINVTRGPSITRYELELSRGTKLSKVTNLADDIALSLGASGVRIAAIPEKISVVGIEVPNKLVSNVLIRDVIDSKEFEKSRSRISFAVGKDIAGNRIICDIAKLPHLLIAGTTGSGKSVCMNSLIVSLLYKAKPDEVKLIMVDPKMVELGIYNDIPHLLIPVVTDPKKASGALQWGVTEMLRRYRLMADNGVRDLEAFNKIARGSDTMEVMPQIVVVIDELADLMLVAAKEVEESICRIAQMGRAAGMHLVIATQRPSADVITGLMKANIPSRIAFAVASAMESRIILDAAGAEKLVGKGDMLYAPLGQGKPRRVQGCFITDDEVASVVAQVKHANSADYSDRVMQEIEKKTAESGKNTASQSMDEPSVADGDEMLPQAVEVILETGQASVSMLQRRLKLGYARAARIMDEMEEKGIVGPFEGSKPRQLLITKEQWELYKATGSFHANLPVEEEIL